MFIGGSDDETLTLFKRGQISYNMYHKSITSRLINYKFGEELDAQASHNATDRVDDGDDGRRYGVVDVLPDAAVVARERNGRKRRRIEDGFLVRVYLQIIFF